MLRQLGKQFLIYSFFLFNLVAQAKELNYIPDRSCRSAVTESEIMACLHAEYNFYDKLLADYHDKILLQLNQADAKQFKQSHQAWQTYKAMNCDLLYKYEKKLLSGIMTLACKTYKNKDRVIELRSFYLKLNKGRDLGEEK